VLDIGCGRGAFLSNIKNKVASCTGLEFNDQAIEKARQAGLDVRKEMIETHAAANPEKYSVVCFFQVLEHINEVKQFLDAALKTLKSGGLLIIGVPNSDPWLLKYDKFHTLNLPPHHAGLWNGAVFQRLDRFFPMKLEKIGYEPLTAIRQQWILVLKHHRFNLLAKILEVIPSFVFGILGKTIGPYSKGISMVAVFRKV
jgi:SAM-dependent methyltransferase